jgi:hypothetical protein
MEETTREHLALAQRNQRFADRLRFADSNAEHSSLGQSPEILWSVVISFYSAVHYINAYLWEIDRFAPKTHAERTPRVSQDQELTTIAANYKVLSVWGFQARYDPRAHISADDAQQAIDELHAIAELVRRELGDS